MITLLAVLGLAVGGTAEVYLRKALYDRVDDRLSEMSQRIVRPHLGGIFFDNPANPVDSVSALLIPTDAGATAEGGVLTYREAAQPGFGPRPRTEYTRLSGAAVARLAKLSTDGRPSNIDLGDGLGDYRVVATAIPPGTVLTKVTFAADGARSETETVLPQNTTMISGLPLAEANATLLQVAAFTGGVVLIALVVAGWAGAVIVRRTLRPLDRVAATASKVAELRLDRGAVQLAQRVPEADTDPRTEVGQVGAALNRMLDHVGGALEARHASEMQVRQFVADASHELRTPLAAIRGYAELSRRSRQPIPDEISHVLTRVESEAKRMTTLVEDLLLLARLDASQPLAQDRVDLTMLVVDAVSDAHAAGPRHHWKLDVPDEPVTVVGDAARLHQVLANLLANARTHTPEGSTVTVRVSASGVLQVIDDGPGIPAELLPHIFERFARGDSSRSRAAGSTGLGLSIVHAVVTAHGGRVEVESRPGRTVFTVAVPTVEQSVGSLPLAG